MHECEHCGRRFDRVTQLRGHQRVHVLQWQECPVCGESRKYLGRHLRETHGLVSEQDQIDRVEEMRQERDQWKQAYEEVRARLDLVGEVLNI